MRSGCCRPLRAGVRVSSREARQDRTVDGDRDACRKGASRSEHPPAECGAALRLELTPLVEASKRASEAPTPPAVEENCPEGMVRLGGKCTAATDRGQTFLAITCQLGAEEACRAQASADHTSKRSRRLDLEGCDEGDAEAFDRLVTQQLDQACHGRLMRSCEGLRVRDYPRFNDVVLAHCRGQAGTAGPWCDVVRREGWPPPR